MTDAEIIELFCDRQERAILELHKNYESILREEARKILNSSNDVEDILNEFYLIAWNRFGDIKPENICAYSVKIVRRLSLYQAKKYNKFNTVELDPEYMYEGCIDNCSETMDREVVQKVFWEYYDSLSSEKRHILYERLYQDTDYEELSKKCNVSKSTLRTWLWRMKKEIIQILADEGVWVSR